MKELFDKNRHRLSDSEKAEVWQRISLAKPQWRTTRRSWLAPTLGVAALAVCCFVFLYFSMPHEADLGYRGGPLPVSQRALDPEDIQADTSEPPGQKDDSFEAARREPTEQDIIPPRGSERRLQDEPVAAGAARSVPRQAQDGFAAKGTEKRAEVDLADVPTAAALDVLAEGTAVTLPEEDEQLTAAVTPESTRVAVQAGGVEAVEEDPADQTGVATRDHHVRGGRSGEGARDLDTAARIQPAAPVGVETPALAIPAEVSIFPLAADTSSWVHCLQSLAAGRLPAADSIKVEAFVNRLDPGYAPVRTGDLVIQVDGAPSPFRPDRTLLRIGIKGWAETSRAASSAAVAGGDTIPDLLARNAVVQVSFNRDQVTGYRWLGSPCSPLAPDGSEPEGSGKEEEVQPAPPFTVAGTGIPPVIPIGYDLWAGQSSVALYEIEWVPAVAGSLTLRDLDAARHDLSPPILARIQLDYERFRPGRTADPASVTQVMSAAVVSKSFEEAPPPFQLAAIMAEFAEVLQGRVGSPVSRLAQLHQMLADLAPALPDSGEWVELMTAIRQAEALFATESLTED